MSREIPCSRRKATLRVMQTRVNALSASLDRDDRPYSIACACSRSETRLPRNEAVEPMKNTNGIAGRKQADHR